MKKTKQTIVKTHLPRVGYSVAIGISVSVLFIGFFSILATSFDGASPNNPVPIVLGVETAGDPVSAKQVSLTGYVEVIHVENFEGEGRYDYYLQVGNEIYELIFSTGMELPEPEDTIRVEGNLLDKRLSVESFRVIVDKSLSGEYRIGNFKYLVIPVGLRGEGFSIPFWDLRGKYNRIENMNEVKQILSNVKTFYAENSYGKVDLDFIYIDPVTIDHHWWDSGDICKFIDVKRNGVVIGQAEVCNDYTYRHCENYYDMYFEVAGKVDLSKYDYDGIFLLHDGRFHGCTMATVGSMSNAKLWMDTRQFDEELSAHEIGHNLGVHHANFLDCEGDDFKKNIEDCKLKEYGGAFDVMGKEAWDYGCPEGVSHPDEACYQTVLDAFHFSSVHKDLLGWIDGNIIEVEENGVYEIYKLEKVPNGNLLQALKVPALYYEEPRWFYLEYRKPKGWEDTEMFNEWNSGPIVHFPISTEPREKIGGGDSYLIDTTPNDENDPSTTQFRSAINLGESWEDPVSGRYSVTTLVSDSEKTKVYVRFKDVIPETGCNPDSEDGNICIYDLKINRNAGPLAVDTRELVGRAIIKFKTNIDACVAIDYGFSPDARDMHVNDNVAHHLNYENCPAKEHYLPLSGLKLQDVYYKINTFDSSWGEGQVFEHSFSPRITVVETFESVEPREFVRGDSNSDGVVDLTDAVFSLEFLFRGGERVRCLDAADANDDGLNDVADAVTTLEHLFRGGDPLPLPYPSCGPDPTEDSIGCIEYTSCN